jgi:hypothetical protein
MDDAAESKGICPLKTAKSAKESGRAQFSYCTTGLWLEKGMKNEERRIRKANPETTTPTSLGRLA